MASRREVLVGGASGFAALGIGLRPHRAAAFEGGAVSAMFVVDTSIAGSNDAIAVAESSAVPVVRFARDIGPAWMDRIEPLWAQGRAPIAGITHGGAYFCIEQLAHGYRLGSAFRTVPARGSAGLVTAQMLSGTAGPTTTRSGTGEPLPHKAADQPVAWLIRPIAS